MFFEPRVFQKGTPVTLNRAACSNGAGYADKVATQVIDAFGTEDGSITEINFENTLPADLSIPAGDETYALVISEDKAILYGITERARIYAAVTLKQLCEHGELVTGRIEDTPDCTYRGYRAYLPGRSSFQLFYDTVD
ncbi:MAG: hypothetical protein IIW31_05220, partial [Clostridia bacterium]|nr:hypothetical protein [Clostridia bacterium]